MTAAPRLIFTIGHSTHELDYFLHLLTSHGVRALADVRSQAVSRIAHFNGDALAAALRARRIKYVPLGNELGARRAEEEAYVDGQAVYERIATLPLFRAGIDRVSRGSRGQVIALMCSEKEPLDCHRTILVCRHLRCHDLAINHILADGSLEAHRDTEHRLLKLMGISPIQGDLFADERQLLEQAYEGRGREIAYCLESHGVAS